MSKIDRISGRVWGHTLAVIALGAACSGHVEERDADGISGGTGGSAAGGASGTSHGGVNGQGGRFGAAGSYGEFGGTYGSGSGGYFGDAGSGPFGGTSGGGATCNPNPWRRGTCALTQGCIDPNSPTPERIDYFPPGHHEDGGPPVSHDAGPSDSGAWDAGISDATTRTSIDVVVPPLDAPGFDSPASDGGTTVAGADICGGPTTTQYAYLAFDFWTDEAPSRAVSIYSVNEQCTGYSLGLLPFVTIAPPVRTWTTQCVVVPYTTLNRVMIETLSAGTVVRNLRFASDCRCPRSLLVPTGCGTVGSDAGVSCKSALP